MVGAAGLEPARPHGHVLLGHARMPVSPRPEIGYTASDAELHPGIRTRAENRRHSLSEHPLKKLGEGDYYLYIALLNHLLQHLFLLGIGERAER